MNNLNGNMNDLQRKEAETCNYEGSSDEAFNSGIII